MDGEGEQVAVDAQAEQQPEEEIRQESQPEPDQ